MMKRTCLWCGGNYYEGFECKMCEENQQDLIDDFNRERWGDDYPDFASQDISDPLASLWELIDERLDEETLTLEELLDEDIVHEPDHYSRWDIEPIEVIMRNGFEFWRGNIVKYASRAGYKIYDGKDQQQSEITDLQKVIRYAEMRINQINGEEKL